MNPCTTEFLDHVGWRFGAPYPINQDLLIIPLNNERTLHVGEVLNLLHLAGATSARTVPLWVAPHDVKRLYGIRLSHR